MDNKPHIVKDSIAEAMIELLKTNKLKEISISQLTIKAGVSRISFYRNFDSKEDVVRYSMERVLLFLEQPTVKNQVAFTYQVYKLLKEHQKYIETIYRSGLDYIFRDVITENLINLSNYDEDLKYFYRGFGYFIFGCLDSWIRSGMKESPEEMVELTQKAATKIREEVLKRN